MSGPARPALEQTQSQPKAHDAVPKITAGDLGDRPNTSAQTQHAESSIAPLTREKATAHLSDINEKQHSDPMKATEIAREPYRAPDSQSGRQQSLQTHRESTSTTGFAGSKTYENDDGKPMKGFESFDKTSGQRTFYGQNKDGGYTQYHVKENGRTLQPLDGNGKPAGEPIHQRQHEPRTPQRPQEGNTENPPAPRQARQPQETHEGAHGGGPPGSWRSHDVRDGGNGGNGGNGVNGGWHPHDGGNGVNGGWHPHEGGNGVNGGWHPHDGGNGGNGGWRPQEGGNGGNGGWRPHEGGNGGNGGWRPHEGGNGGNGGWHPHEGGNGGNGWGAANARPQWRPESRSERESLPGSRYGDSPGGGTPPGVGWHPRPDGHGPFQPQNPEFDRGNRLDRAPDRFGPHADRPWGAHDGGPGAARPEFANRAGRPAGPDRTEGVRSDLNRPDAGRLQNPHDNPLAGRQPGLRFDGQHASKSPVEPGAMHAMDRGRVQDASKAGLDSQGRALQNLHNMEGGGLKANGSQNLRQLIDSQRTVLQGHLVQNVRNNAHEVLQAQRTMSAQRGDFSARIQERPHLATDLHAANHLSLDNASAARSRDLAQAGKTVLQLAEVGRQLGPLLDMLRQRNNSIDRVPGADQSRLLIRETLQPSRNQSISQDLTSSMQIQRTLNLRSLETGSQSNQQQNLFKVQDLSATRDLINRVGSQDILNAAQKLTDAGSKLATDGSALNNRADLTLSGRILDASNAANRQLDQSRALKDLAAANRDVQPAIQTSRQVQFTVPEKLSDSKTDAGKMKGEMSGEGKGSLESKEEDQKISEIDKDAGKKKAPEDELNALQMADLMAAKLRDLKEKEKAEKEKEKDKLQDKDKNEQKQRERIKYRVKQGDTLAGLASSFLSNAKLAPCIFHLNRTVIPITTYNGKQYASPTVDSTIWLPGDDEISKYNSAGSGKEYSQIEFGALKFASAEEELMARFGRRWFGSADKKTAADRHGADGIMTGAGSKDSERIKNIEKILGPFSADSKISEKPESEGGASSSRGIAELASMTQAERDQRRANIEKVLGPFMSQDTGAAASERPTYKVRLGESLKSIALKHPLLKNVEAWKLLAAVNGLSLEVDAKGSPLVQLKRGMILNLPGESEIAAFRETGLLPGGEAGSGEFATADCQDCQDSSELKSSSVESKPESVLSAVESEPLQNGRAEPLDCSPVSSSLVPQPEDALRAVSPKRTTLNTWRQAVTTNSVRALEEFFKSSDEGNRKLVLNDPSSGGPSARLLARGSQHNLDTGYLLSLEVLNGSAWEPVVEYELNSTGAIHRTYDGSYRRTRPVNMSSSQVLEVAQQDIQRNWKNYVSLFADC